MTEIIKKTIDKLRSFTHVESINNWRFCRESLANLPTINEIENWAFAPINDKNYIVWEAGQQVIWLAQQFTIPSHVNGYSISNLSLRLCLTWWAENAQVFVNGELVQEGDLFDSSARVLLTDKAIPYTNILVVIRLVSPGHDIGGLMRAKLVYESDKIDPGFFADELEILTKYLREFEAENLPIIESKISKLDWDNLENKQIFNHSIINIREELQPLAINIKKRRFNILGHAHLDMAWLWTLDETYKVAESTFKSVLNLQKDYPELTFCHTTAALYNWVEKNRPKLFNSIKTAVSLNKWEVLGGMWVEPEVNLSSGESLVRQLLYGQKYIKEQFGYYTKIAWLPDSFGFQWTLPQLFKLAEIDYFVTGKLHWNDTNKFPHGCFWWESPDGTKILTLMSPPNVTGVMDTNPITMTNYSVSWEKQTNLQEIFWLPGVGDHGGGPTRDMLDVARKWDVSPFFPKIQFTTANSYLEKIAKTENLPVWNDELYLELHRGCYTTHGYQKKANRYCENLLYQAELFTCLNFVIDKLHLKTNSVNLIDKYQVIKSKIEQSWKGVLLNQFHDILPGTSITEVFDETNQNWSEIITTGKQILRESLQEIANKIKLPSPPVKNAQFLVIFNPTNWLRSEIVSLNLPHKNYQVYDLKGNKLIQQISNENNLLFFAENIPSLGYHLYWLTEENITTNNLTKGEFILENELISVTIDKNTGEISNIYDQTTQKEILSGKGNQLQFFTDKGQYWDAWNIDPNYENNPLSPAKLQSINWLEKGNLRSIIRVVKTFNNSEFIQDYILEKNSPIFKISTTVNWNETHVLVKTLFPLNLDSNYATYEIACGVIQRTTNPQTNEEKAKWEVFGHSWVDLFDHKKNYGVSLLNDSKYGYDIKSNNLRLTLLRSSQWPDKSADKGTHHFTYSLYCHKNSWQTAKTVHFAHNLNLPLLPVFPEKSSQQILPPVGKMLDLGDNSLVLMALKFAENNPETLILRCYESEGDVAELSLDSDLNLQLGQPVNLLEFTDAQNIENVNSNVTKLNKWQIAGYKIKINDLFK
jgi:alpha-mannosidase